MGNQMVVFTIFLIFTGAAVLSTLALYTRQSLLVAYILLGVLLGPWGLHWVGDSTLIEQVSDVGILFLLFLLGLHLHPQNLLHMLRKATWVSVVSSLLFGLLGAVIGFWFGFSLHESLVIGAVSMFSSTIIGLKLLPTTILHHQHTGEVMISILLIQDLLAIIVLLVLHGASTGDGLSIRDLVNVVIALPALIAFAFLMEKYVLVKLIARFDRTQEYIFLLSIGWCLSIAQLGGMFGLSLEIGAFIGGVALAASPIALYIAESLKPLRDFFLVLFFFSIGAGFNLEFFSVVFIPALVLAVVILISKPAIFYVLLRRSGENKAISSEVGVRLGQASEFSLLVAAMAAEGALISSTANYFIQAMTIITFIVSSYIVVLRYPTPIALTEKMRRD